MLPIKQQRFTRKRRREGSTGEGNETEDGMWFYNLCINIIFTYILIDFEVGENKKKDKKDDDSISQNQTNDPIDCADDISNGVEVANMETEKIDNK